MLSIFAIALLVPALVITLRDWRRGLFALLIVAFLQDPARKLEVDQPVYFTILAGIVMAAAYIRAQSPKPFLPSQITGWTRYMRWPSYALVVIIVLQGIASMVRYGNPMMAAIGAISYLAPLPALMLGYHYALRTGAAGVRRWLAAYLVCAVIVLPSIALEYAGVDWPALGQVGVGLSMYQDDAILIAHSGFLRASETAAWHTASAVCLLLLLSSMQRLSRKQVVTSVLLVVGLLVLGVLTGRRKIFVEIVIFMAAYVSLLLLFGKGGLRWAIAVFAGGMISYALMTWLVVEQPIDVNAIGNASYGHYAQRSASVAGDVADRFVEMGLDTIDWAIEGFGWLGGGLGIASQGAQHFGGGAEIYGGAGEGGLGKITAELGVPGLIVVVWFAVAAIRLGWRVLTFVSVCSAPIARLAFGLVSFLIANLAVFFVATQVFGDVFVLIMLGIISGFLLATPVLADRERPRPAAAKGYSNQRNVRIPVGNRL